MSIGVMDTFKDEKPVEKKSGKGAIITFAVIIILAAAAAAYYFFLR
jgi:flagellar basal body-associated protein FliL